LNCSYVYFSGRQSLQPLLIGYFLTTVKIAEYTRPYVFYPTFTNFFVLVTFFTFLTCFIVT